MRKVEDWITGFMSLTENSEPPTTYKKWTAISLIASVLQRKCRLDWGPIKFFPNMYIVLVGPSGRCRKGTIMSIGHKFLRDLGIPLAAEATTREALIVSLEKAGEKQSVMISETGELYNHNSLTIFSPELTVFLGYNNLQLISDLTDWYDCREPWEYQTKNVGTNVIDAVYVNMLGATTPDLVRSALPQDAVGGGLSSRIIFVSEFDRSKTISFPFLGQEQVTLQRDLSHDLDDIYSMSGEFQITESFKDAWDIWYQTSSKNPPFNSNPKFEGYVNRRGNHAMKLSMIISASESSKMIIRGDHLLRAVEYLEEVEKKMPTVFFGHGTADNADITGRVLQTVNAVGEIHITQLIRTYVGYVRGLEEMYEIVNKLHTGGYVVFDKNSKKVKTTGDYS